MADILVYATVDDMVDRFSERELIELTDRENIPQTTINQKMAEQAIEDATAVVNGYVGVV